MKIGIIDYYNSESNAYKDPILIPQSLRKADFDVELISRSTTKVSSLFGFKLIDLEQWLKSLTPGNRPGCVIAISRFDPALTPALSTIRSYSIPLILKGDTDGTLGYPLIPNYLRSVPFGESPLNALRHLKWRLPFKYFVGKKLQHFEYANSIVYESPGAGVNLAYLLQNWSLNQHTKKLAWIPNSVHEDFVESKLYKKEGFNIVAVGRWDDQLVKGTDLLTATISNALKQDFDISFSIIGRGSEKIKSDIPIALRERVDASGHLDSHSLRKVVSGSKIMLVPSRLESFSIASAEALCSGCSLVVTPVESLIYLSGGGNFGSVSRDFTPESLTAALTHEIRQWRNGARDPHYVSSYWRQQLNQITIGRRWVDLISQLTN